VITASVKTFLRQNWLLLLLAGIPGVLTGMLVKKTDWTYVRFKIFLVWLPVRTWVLFHPYLTVIGSVILLFVAVWIYVKLRKRRKVLTLKIKYKKLSKHKSQYSLEELSTLWKGDSDKEKQAKLPEAKRDSGVFDSGIIDSFFLAEVLNKSFIDQKSFEVITSLLSVLNKEGKCPSVVRMYGDPEYNLPADSYAVLAKVTLTEHSVLVARRILAIADSPPMRARLIITALGHDIGKIPSCRKGGRYAMGDHPMSSVMVLNSIPGFTELPFSKETGKAILHHHIRADSMLGQYLKEADNSAREIEMLRFSEPQSDGRDNQQPKGNDGQNKGSQPEQPQGSTKPADKSQSQDKGNGQDSQPEQHKGNDGQKEEEQDTRSPMGETQNQPVTKHGKDHAVEQFHEGNDKSNPVDKSREDSNGAAKAVEQFQQQQQPPEDDDDAPTDDGWQQSSEDAEGQEELTDGADLEDEQVDNQPAEVQAATDQPQDCGNADRAQADNNGDGSETAQNKPAQVKAPDIHYRPQSTSQVRGKDKVKINFKIKKIPWFVESEMISALKPNINQIFGNSWTACSMNNGIVYFQTGIIWDAFKTLALEHQKKSIVMAEADQSLRQDYLYTIVKLMRKKGMIANLIQEEYFGGKFQVYMTDGQIHKGYFTPFYAEVFAESVSELEALKKGKLKDIVKIEPAYGCDLPIKN
jgi:hypothetical protein